MFSPNAYENPKLIDICFIAGLSTTNIRSILNSEMSKTPKTEILLSVPEDKGTITQGILDVIEFLIFQFVFPDGLNFSYSEEPAKFYAVVLTNEKGIRSYVYVLRFYEKVCDEDFKIEVKENPNNSKISISNYTYEGKFYFIPIAICLWSHTSNTEFFKNLLQELYKLITYKESFYAISNEQVKDYQNCELLNYFIFLTSLIKPASYTTLNLNLRFTNLEIYFPSKYELPPGDLNIEILFKTLEISIIIKLWISILSEKHVIILANQNFLLFTICEALMSLLFPFRWLHTYIPVLSSNELDYLESPTPYIMGVHSNYTDYQYLKELFPNHVICDVNTSQIFSNSILSLPSLDENKLRKKLLYIKNPEMYNIEEISIKDYDSGKSLLMEDVSPHKSFSENVQYVFFRIFRTHLGSLDKYMNNKVFDSQKFLDDFIDEEYREFWGKIINTVAFEYFILSDQYLDDSNIRIFKNIITNKEEEKYDRKNDMLNITVNLPENINELFGDLITRAKLKLNSQENVKSYVDKFNKIIQNYNEVLSEVKGNNKFINRRKLIFHTHSHLKRNNLSGIDLNIPNQRHSLVISDTNVKDSFRITNCNSNINIETNSFISFYSKNYKGFVEFIHKVFEILQPDPIFEIEEYIKDKKLRELEEILNLSNNKILFFGNSSKQKFNKNVQIANSYFSNFTTSDSYQFYLSMAYYLEEFPYLKDLIMDHYLKALEMDRKSFPRIRFMQFLNLYEIRDLKYILRRTDDNLLRKIIDLRIQKILKSKNKLGKSLVLNPDEYFKKETNDDFEGDLRLRKKSSSSMLRKSSGESEEDFLKSSFKRKGSNYLINLKKDEIKNKEKIMKFNIINNYAKISKSEKDPLSLAEDISIKIFSFITNNSLDKYKQDMITPKFLLELFNTPQFTEIKMSVAQLQKINLNKIYSNKCKISFWLNIYNFLVIFTIIIKKEVLSNYYEWYRFLKNSYYNIGGFEISLYEIENIILTQGKNSISIYGEIVKFSEDDPKNKLHLEKVEKLISFGISIPTKSSPPLRIYFPSNLDNLLNINACEYFSKNVNIDLDRNLLSVSEYIMWNDPNFKDNLDSFSEILSTDFIKFINDFRSQLSFHVVKYDWSLHFCNFNNSS